MIFDTDVLIWLQRGVIKAGELVDSADERLTSVQTYMELMQNATAKRQQQIMRTFLHAYDFKVEPLTENIGHRATIYIEEYALSHGLRAGDAIIAATAFECNQVLATGNKKHFSIIPGLKLEIFKHTS